MKIGLLFLCLLFLVESAYTQQLSKEQTIGDLEFLLQKISTYNRALPRYSPDFEQAATAITATVTDSVSLLEYFALVSQIAALSNEGHFLLGKMTEAVHKGFVDNQYAYLPLSVYVIDNNLYVKANHGAERDLEPYAQIVSINGQPAAQIVHQLYLHIPSDGHIPSNLAAKASQAFNWKYYLYIDQPEQFEIEYIAPNTQHTVTILVPVLTRAQQIALAQEKQKTTATPPKAATSPSIKDFYELSIQEDYAVLTLKSYSRKLVLDELKLKPKRIYKKIFVAIETAKVEHLIVDLRGHTGGRSEFAKGLIPFITKRCTKNDREQSVSWKGDMKTYKLPKTHRKAFKGKLYGLVDGHTFSSGAVTARYLKEYGEAVFLGEETGTRYEGFVAGSYEYIYLPSTKIRLAIARYHLQFPRSQKQTTSNRGLIPDHLLYNSIEDIQQGYDRILASAVALIQQKHTEKKNIQ